MDYKILVIFSILFVLFIYIGLLIRFVKDDHTNNSNERYLILNEIKSGDLIFVTKKTFKLSIFNGFTSLDYYHGGVFVKENGNYYIIEAANYPGVDMKGLIKIPLSKWLRYNKNMSFIYYKLNSELDDETISKRLLKAYEKNREESDITSLDKRIIRYYFERKDYEPIIPSKSYNCSEYLSAVLSDANILTKLTSTDTFMSNYYLKNKINTTVGNKYSDGEHVNFDNFNVLKK